MTTKKSAYAAAGVDIDEMQVALKAIKRRVRSTNTKGVLSDLGTFGGMFTSPGKDHAIVASTDGVGTKLKVAVMAKRHDTVGEDIVNHCVNDILVQGAMPLFFLDYLGTGRLKASVFADIVSGLATACRANNCTLLGGETAEMPGLYPRGEYDLVGTIIGSVEKKKVVTGRSIRHGDIVIGLASNGLHTNGYSLARKVIFDQAGLTVGRRLPGTHRTVANVLLAPHKSYLKPVTALLKKVKVRGMAHITGGGFIDNIPRVVPAGLTTVIARSQWKVPPVFRFIEETGKVDHEEMYRVFNMGIGYCIVVRERDAGRTLRLLKRMRCRAIPIGFIRKGRKRFAFAD